MLFLLVIPLKQQQQTKYGDGVLLEVVLCACERQRGGGQGKKNEILKVLLCLLDITEAFEGTDDPVLL